MSNHKFRVGDKVRLQFPMHSVDGVITEDRGPIGVKGRRLYTVEFHFESQPDEIRRVELPADEMELVENAVSTK